MHFFHKVRAHGGHGMRHAMRGRRGGFFGGGPDIFGDAFGGGLGGHGGGRGRRRVFDGTELRLLLLALIGEQPRHGYDLIKAIEERTAGSYAPSPGVIYPTLTMLEDMGHIAEQAAEGAKRLFAITDAGRVEIGEQAELIEALFARLDGLNEEVSGGGGRAPVKRAMVNLAMVLRERMAQRDREDLGHDIAAILDEAARRIERL
jgi:DNA-binding PadR family transcriptional regulator